MADFADTIKSIHDYMNRYYSNVGYIKEILLEINDRTDFYDRHPLHVLAANNDAETMKILLYPSFISTTSSGEIEKSGARIRNAHNVHSWDNGGNTPLHVAIYFGSYLAVELLLNHRKIDLLEFNYEDESPLLWACLFDNPLEESRVKIKNLLIQYFRNTKSVTSSDDYEDKKDRYESELKKLYAKGITLASEFMDPKDSKDFNKCDEYGILPLHVACRYPQLHKKILMTILNGTKDINAITPHTYSPLHVAINKGNINAVISLLNRPDILVNEGNNPPLEIAIRAKHVEIVNILLSRDDIIIIPYMLHCAADYCPELIIPLLQKSPNLNVNELNNGQTFMMSVVWNIIENELRAAILQQLLLCDNFDPNVVNSGSNTLLHILLVQKNVLLINILLGDTRVSKTIVNNVGLTAENYAEKYNIDISDPPHSKHCLE